MELIEKEEIIGIVDPIADEKIEEVKITFKNF